MRSYEYMFLVFLLAVYLALLVAGCASCPPCQDAPTANRQLHQCEEDLRQSLDLNHRCQKELQ